MFNIQAAEQQILASQTSVWTKQMLSI